MAARGQGLEPVFLSRETPLFSGAAMLHGAAALFPLPLSSALQESTQLRLGALRTVRDSSPIDGENVPVLDLRWATKRCCD